MKKIFVIDDEYAMAKLLKLELESRGYTVEFALSCNEAFEKLDKFFPELITLDIMMPEMNGFQVFELLTKDERYNKIPVVFVSVISTDINKKRAMEMGAVDAIPKPINFDKLIKIIEQCKDGFVRLK